MGINETLRKHLDPSDPESGNIPDQGQHLANRWTDSSEWWLDSMKSRGAAIFQSSATPRAYIGRQGLAGSLMVPNPSSGEAMVSYFDEDLEDGAPRFHAKGFCALLFQLRYRMEIFRLNPGSIVLFYSHPIVTAKAIEEWLASHPIPQYFIVRREIRSCIILQGDLPLLGLPPNEMRGIFSLPFPTITDEERQKYNEDEVAALTNAMMDVLRSFYLFSSEAGCFAPSAEREADFQDHWLPAYRSLINNAAADQAREEKDGLSRCVFATASLKRVDAFIGNHYLRTTLRQTKYSHRHRLFDWNR